MRREREEKNKRGEKDVKRNTREKERRKLRHELIY